MQLNPVSHFSDAQPVFPHDTVDPAYAYREAIEFLSLRDLREVIVDIMAYEKTGVVSDSLAEMLRRADVILDADRLIDHYAQAA